MKEEVKVKHEIRDPIHGAIAINLSERHILDHDFVQRLRGIRQLGFTQFSFPSATHTRFSHSIGVMHIAEIFFDTLHLPISESKKSQYRSLLRMTALLHDCGHGPYSHAAEYAMPLKSELFAEDDTGERATHEDYTVAILTQTDVNDLLKREFGFSGTHVAALIDPHIETKRMISLLIRDSIFEPFFPNYLLQFGCRSLGLFDSRFLFYRCSIWRS